MKNMSKYKHRKWILQKFNGGFCVLNLRNFYTILWLKVWGNLLEKNLKKVPTPVNSILISCVIISLQNSNQNQDVKMNLNPDKWFDKYVPIHGKQSVQLSGLSRQYFSKRKSNMTHTFKPSQI